jgi:uncharacterized protein YggL (DUF469 family)
MSHIAGEGGINIMFRVCLMFMLGLLVSLPVNLRAEHEQKNIDEIMTDRQKEIELAFSDYSKTKAVPKLAEIEKLNENAGGSLIQWLDSGHLPCCIDKDSDVKRTWEEDQEKFKFYLKSICKNYTRIAGYYAESNVPRKAQSIYQYVTEAFDNPEFDKCLGEAKAGLEGLGR